MTTAVRRRRLAGSPAGGPAAEEREEAEERAGEGQGDPREVDREQGDQHPLQDRRAADRHDLVHLVGAVGGQQQAAAEDEEARQPRPRASSDRTTGLRSSPATSAAATGSASPDASRAASRAVGPLESGHAGFGVEAYGVQR